MLSKLAFRNAKRSIKDYIVYLFTVIVSFSLVIAFNMVVYSAEIQELSKRMDTFRDLVTSISVIMVLVIGWLINYTMKFMLTKRSKEFGTYMILGIEKRDIIRLFLVENIFIGFIALVASIFIGAIFKELLVLVIMNIFEMPYSLSFDTSWKPFLLSLGYFVLMYLFATFNMMFKIKKLKIHSLLYMEKQNEQKNLKSKKVNVFLFVVFVICGITGLWLFKEGVRVMDKGDISSQMVGTAIPLVLISIYGIAIKTGDFIVEFVLKNKKIKYNGDNMFILRQFTSKIKTMGITLGTLSLLTTVSLLAFSNCFMYSDMFDARIENLTAYDLMISKIYSDCPEELWYDTCNDENKLAEYMDYIEEHYTIEDEIKYDIYTNKENTINKHINDEAVSLVEIDCFIKLSDYNKLMQMRGLKGISLEDDEFFIVENRDISKEIDKYLNENKELTVNNKKLKAKGHNYENYASCIGTHLSYYIIVPDEVVANMKVFDRSVAMNTAEETTQKFYEDIKKEFGTISKHYEDSDEMVYKLDFRVSVKGEMIASLKGEITTLMFALLYIALIFTAIVATVLAIQALSDSSKLKYNYSIMSKLGVSDEQLFKTIRKQLMIFFIFPVVYPIIINASVTSALNHILGPYLSNENTYIYSIFYSIGLFLFVYFMYFVTTYFSYKKNIME